MRLPNFLFLLSPFCFCGLCLCDEFQAKTIVLESSELRQKHSARLAEILSSSIVAGGSFSFLPLTKGLDENTPVRDLALSTFALMLQQGASSQEQAEFLQQGLIKLRDFSTTTPEKELNGWPLFVCCIWATSENGKGKHVQVEVIEEKAISWSNYVFSSIENKNVIRNESLMLAILTRRVLYYRSSRKDRFAISGLNVKLLESHIRQQIKMETKVTELFCLLTAACLLKSQSEWRQMVNIEPLIIQSYKYDYKKLSYSEWVLPFMYHSMRRGKGWGMRHAESASVTYAEYLVDGEISGWHIALQNIVTALRGRFISSVVGQDPPIKVDDEKKQPLSESSETTGK